jgi:hypothetical protein
MKPWLLSVAVMLGLAGRASAQPIVWTISPLCPIDFLQVYVPAGRNAVTVGPTANPGDVTRPDTAMTWGWNNTHDGGQYTAGEPALMYRVEDYYKPVSPGNSYMESHLQYVSAAGVVLRPWQVQITRETDYVFTGIQADAFNYLGHDGTQWVKWVAGQQMLMHGEIIASYTNNSQPFRQAKVNGSLVSLVYVDTANRIHVGDSSHGAGDVVIDAAAVEIGGAVGVTATGSSCTVTAITGGVITAAVCVP